nr:PAS domain-containing protein [uncultured Desulfobulbus sp.]
MGWALCCVHPDDLPSIRKAWHAAVAHPENTVAVEYRHKHKDGGWVYSEAVAQSFFHDPAINGMLATVRDTTARKVAEESLQHQGALLEAMVRNIPFDFWARDTNEKIIIQSEQSVKLWGNLRVEPETEATIPSKTLESWQNNNAQVFEGNIVSYDCALITKDGECSEYHSIVAPIRDRDEILGIMRVNLDITEERQVQEDLRESEERLQLVMEGSQLGYWDWDIKEGEVRRNKRWAEMLGYTQKEIEDSVKQWTDLHHPDDREAAWESIDNHLQGKSPAHRMEYRMLAKDGQYKWILDQASVTKRDVDGTPLRMSGTHTDITQYKQKELEREKLQSQLAQAQKQKANMFCLP